jgi:hypothetical protein
MAIRMSHSTPEIHCPPNLRAARGYRQSQVTRKDRNNPRPGADIATRLGDKWFNPTAQGGSVLEFKDEGRCGRHDPADDECMH